MWHAVFCACIAMMAVDAAAQYPNRPIRIVVGFLAGGPTDIVARTIAPRVSDALGQPIIVDNRPGAGGVIATDHVAKSPADGHTLLMGTIGGLAVAMSLVPNRGYDTLRDLEPITQTVTVTNFLVVPAASSIRSLQDLLATARARPGTLTYASTGNGTAPYLAGELMKSMGRVDVVHVPYKGSAATLTAMLRSEVDIGFENSLIVMPHIASGKLRALAVTGERRSALMPDLPTMSEAGLPGYSASGWYGLLAPKGTPAPVIERLHQEAVRALRAPDVIERLGTQGAEPVGGSPGAFSELIRAEIGKWGKLVKDAGLQVQ
ncbi:MAG: tripartite tricarboxylate transporter substrate binding protein [Burkholderiales bacterium]